MNEVNYNLGKKVEGVLRGKICDFVKENKMDIINKIASVINVEISVYEFSYFCMNGDFKVDEIIYDEHGFIVYAVGDVREGWIVNGPEGKELDGQRLDLEFYFFVDYDEHGEFNIRFSEVEDGSIEFLEEVDYWKGYKWLGYALGF